MNAQLPRELRRLIRFEDMFVGEIYYCSPCNIKVDKNHNMFLYLRGFIQETPISTWDRSLFGDPKKYYDNNIKVERKNEGFVIMIVKGDKSHRWSIDEDLPSDYFINNGDCFAPIISLEIK